MSDISIADIQAARNQKVAVESKETERIAAELEGAHQDALALKERLREQEGEASLPQQQVGNPLPPPLPAPTRLHLPSMHSAMLHEGCVS